MCGDYRPIVGKVTVKEEVLNILSKVTFVTERSPRCKRNAVELRGWGG